MARESIKKAAIEKNKVTITEIARQAGVSVPTVSRVVNGRSDVSPETRARVEDLLRHHGYRRRPSAPGDRAALVDLVFNDLDSPWAVEIIRGSRRSRTRPVWGRWCRPSMARRARPGSG